VGRARLRRRRRRAAELLGEHGDELAAASSCPRGCSSELGASRRTTCATSTPRRGAREQREGEPRAATVAEIERELLELYRDPRLDEKPALLEQRGGAFYSEAATRSSRRCGRDGRRAGRRRAQRRRVAGLADDDVVELLARITTDGPLRCRSPRWRRSCWVSSSTWPHTSA
jgi:6-phospho-beta-glucosidase